VSDELTSRGWERGSGNHGSVREKRPLPGSPYLRWPLVSGLGLDVSLDAVPCARRHLREALREWAVPGGLAGDAELIGAELVTNAIEVTLPLQAARPDEIWPVGMRLLANRERLVVEVWDCHPGVPIRQVAAKDAECGRGLAIVAELANRWGTRRLSAHVKAVWAELLLPTR
jgi:anti-sigma regulatory factor (Ser/Thr protein kinase)